MRSRPYVVLLLLALAGCGFHADPPQASSTPPATVSLAPTPSPTSSPSMLPDTRAGAVAFVRQYVGLLNHAQATGDTGPARRVSDANCHSCSQVLHSLDVVYSQGAHVRGGSWHIRHIVARRRAASGSWVLYVTCSYGRQSVIEIGHAPKIHHRGISLVAIDTADTKAGWRVIRMVRS